MSAGDDTPARRRGAYSLSDVADPRLAVACRKCGRRGDYDVARLLAAEGDRTLPDVLRRIVETCRKPDGTGRCGAIYDPLPRFKGQP